MPGPSDPVLPEWATDVNHPAGADPWSAQPNKVDPGVAKTATGWTPADKPPASWLNFLLNRITAWVAYLASFFNATDDEYIYPVTKTRTVVLSAAKAEIDANATKVGATAVEGAYVSIAGSTAGKMWVHLNRYLPHGAEIINVKCSLDRGVASARTVTLTLIEVTLNMATGSNVTATLDNVDSSLGAPTGVIVLDGAPGATADVDAFATEWDLQLSVTSAGTDELQVRAFEIEYTEPSPWNI